MADINHVTLVGRLVRDSELVYLPSGQPVCRFSIAVNRKRKNGDQWVDEANFFDIVLWGRMGEAIGKYLLKGKQVGIEGELKQDRWEQDGQTRSKVEIVASNVMLLGGGSGGGSSSSGNSNPGGQGNTFQKRDGGGYNSSQSSYQGSGGYSGPVNESPEDFTDDIPF